MVIVQGVGVMDGLSNIQFPVYLVGEEKPQEDSGVLFFHRIDKEGEETLFVLDDINMPGNTLAMRRLQVLSENRVLYKINYALFFIADLIKVCSPSKWFIDSTGKIFRYTKSKSVNLVFKKIKQIIRLETGGAVIEVEGISTRFKTLFAPNDEKFAGVLQVGLGYILYGLYVEKPNDTRRKI